MRNKLYDVPGGSTEHENIHCYINDELLYIFKRRNMKWVAYKFNSDGTVDMTKNFGEDQYRHDLAEYLEK